MWLVWEGKYKGIGMCFLHSLDVDEAAALHNHQQGSQAEKEGKQLEFRGDTDIQGVRC